MPGDGLDCTDCADPIASPATTTIYHLLGGNASGCTATDSVMVTVIAEGQIEAESVRTICLGSSIQLQASDGIAWKWSPPDGLSCPLCRDPIASPTTTTHYTVTVYGPEGCLAIDTVTINVVPPPKVGAGDDAAICPGGNTRLHATGARTVQWSPTTGLSCSDCLDPLASPPVTTTYIVSDTSEYGCVGRDSVTVFVTAGESLRAHIDTTYRLLPGTALEVPVMLDDRVDQTVDTVTLGVGYNPAILRLHGESLAGTLLDGWRREAITDSLGGFGVRFIGPGSGPLGGPGPLLKLKVAAYLGDSTSSRLPFVLSLGYQPCLEITTAPGRVVLDSICGLSYRLITTTARGYALKQNSPNPFNPATKIEFSLGLDGPTLLEVLDATGRRVALLLEGNLGPGNYAVVWDGSSAPSGLYKYRLTSGSWSAIGSMLLVK
jgi:hypothetical protein